MEWDRIALTAAVALAWSSSAKDTLIDTQTPYSSGVVALGYLDTVSFSTRLRLWSATVCGAMCDERSVDVVGFIGIPSGSAGMRASAGTETGRGCFFNGIGYSPAPDTSWYGDRQFPDSLIPLDTVDGGFFQSAPSLRWPELVVKEWLCRWIGCIPICEGLVPDWNYITYASCPDGSRMSFQFAFDTLIGGASGEVVRWAVDSAGNGVFRTAQVSVGKARLGPLQWQRGGRWERQVFDLRGGLLHGERWSGVGVRRDAVRGRAVVEVQVGRLGREQ